MLSIHINIVKLPSTRAQIPLELTGHTTRSRFFGLVGVGRGRGLGLGDLGGSLPKSQAQHALRAHFLCKFIRLTTIRPGQSRLELRVKAKLSGKSLYKIFNLSSEFSESHRFRVFFKYLQHNGVLTNYNYNG